MERPRQVARLTLAATTALLVIYLAASLSFAFLLWFHEGFCDEAETDCSLPWTVGRVARWIAWPLIGATLVAAYRSARQRARGVGEARAGRFTTPLLVLVALGASVLIGAMAFQVVTSR